MKYRAETLRRWGVGNQLPVAGSQLPRIHHGDTEVAERHPRISCEKPSHRQRASSPHLPTSRKCGPPTAMLVAARAIARRHSIRSRITGRAFTEPVHFFA
jgi:hypothetical protein